MLFQGKPLSGKSLWFSSLIALGVVYGDIGTSPLYTMSQIFFGHGNVALTSTNILGGVGAVLWALTLVVTVKYVIFVLRAEYQGEGGIFALLGILKGVSKKAVAIVSVLLILAAGLLFGDGIITPAISVLSAVEGLKVLAPSLASFVVPITILILTALFAVQYKGTAKIGTLFGVLMVIWFIFLAVLGIKEILMAPQILSAFNPWYALEFFRNEGVVGVMLALGAVILAVTGGEALFADLGHFGVKPIRLSWLSLVYPALILNYLGQGAFLLHGGQVMGGDIFFSLIPNGLLIPSIILAMVATIIASQALISGAFSLAAQAIVQNLSPRLRVVHSNVDQEGQIYLPAVNWTLYLGCLLLVLQFKSSANLASAYGLAETGVMSSTSIAMILISRYRWNWSWWKSVLVFGSFTLLDLAFLVSNSLKFMEGGFVPLTIGLVLFLGMMTWRWGREGVARAYDSFIISRTFAWLMDLKRRLRESGGVLVDEMGRIVETNRAIVFLKNKPYQSEEEGVPAVARLYLKRNGALPRCMIFLNVAIKKEPYLSSGDRSEVFHFGSDMYAINARYGFMETPDVRELLSGLSIKGLIPFNISRCTISAGEEDLVVDTGAPFGVWVRAMFFKYLLRLAVPAYEYFGLSADTNTTVVLVPIHVSSNGTDVVRLSDDDVAI